MGDFCLKRLLFLGPVFLAFVFSCGKSPSRRGGDQLSHTTEFVDHLGVPDTRSRGESQGGWESSGGDGVACFAGENEAISARNEMNKNGYLSSKSRAQVKTLQTLDSYENVTTTDEFLQQGKLVIPHLRYLHGHRMLIAKDLLGMKSRDEVLERVIQVLELDAPLFAERVRVLQKRFPIQNWVASTKVSEVNDSKPKLKLQENCILIQLANRYTRSSKGKVPETRIVYDQELLEKFLTPVDQAILVLHEYLYEIGKEGGHEDSNFLRRLNVLLFSLDLPKDRKAWPHSATALRKLLNTPYGDYMRFFLEDREFKPASQAVPEGTQTSRYQSLVSMMYKLRMRKAECLGQGKQDVTCLDEIFQNGTVLNGLLSREEAFLFLTRFHLDRALSVPWNSEHLVAQNLDIEQTKPEAIDQQLALACDSLSTKPPLAYIALTNKALEYCQQSLKKSVSPFNARTIEQKANCSLSTGRGSSEVARISGSHENLRILVKTEMNSENASIFSEIPVPGRLIDKKNVTDEFAHGEGGTSYSAFLTYAVRLDGANARYPIESFLKLYPQALKKADLVVFAEGATTPHEVALDGASAINYIFSPTQNDWAQSALVSVSLEFPLCKVVDTSLPYEPTDFVWAQNRHRLQKLKVPTPVE